MSCALVRLTGYVRAFLYTIFVTSRKWSAGIKKPPMNGGAKERKGRTGAAFIERGFDEGARARQPKP